jgi:nickel-dependent lactate racemase
MNYISVPYIDRVLDIEIPEGNLVFDVEPEEAPPTADINKTLRNALEHPIGAIPLSKSINSGQKILIIADDFTRLTPSRDIIPVLLDTLNQAGIRDRDIRLIIASGAHRTMKQSEVEVKYSGTVKSRIEILIHHYQDPGELMDYGKTGHGTHILINRCIAEADFVIAVGHIIPHHPAGWSGGAKAILPGIAGEETIAQLHILGAMSSKLGEVNSVMREEMEEVAERVGLDFILNVVLNCQGEIVDAVSGHFVQAHRAGVDLSRKIYAKAIPSKSDLTISSTSPIDHDFFQGDKGIFTAGLTTRTGGEIVLVTGCLEGINPNRPELASLVGKLTNTQILNNIQRGKISDLLMASESIVLNDAKQTHQITIVSDGLTQEMCQIMGFNHLTPESLGSYIRQHLDQTPSLKVGLLRQSTSIYPIPPIG